MINHGYIFLVDPAPDSHMPDVAGRQRSKEFVNAA